MYCDKCKKEYDKLTECPVCSEPVFDVQSTTDITEDEIDISMYKNEEKILKKSGRKKHTALWIILIIAVAAGALILNYVKSSVQSPKGVFSNNLFNNGLLAVCKDDKWGYVDKNNNTVIDFKFSGAYPFSNGLALVVKDEKAGFIDTAGNTVIDFKYDSASSFKEDRAIIVNDEKYGFIDTTGKEILKPEYDRCFGYSEGMAIVCKNDRYYFVDTNGNKISDSDYEEALEFSEGLAAVRQDGKWGYINKNGALVIKPDYNEVQSFSEGFAAVCKDGKWGFINKKGNVVLKPTYSEAKAFSENYAVVKSKSNQYIIIDKKMKEYAKLSHFDEVSSVKNGLLLVKLNDKCGFINPKGETKIPLDYQFAADFTNDVAVIGQAAWCFAINAKNETVFEPIEGKSTQYFKDGYAVILSADNKQGVIDKKGNIIIKPQYDDIMPVNY